MTTTLNASLKGKRVLLVDDSETIRAAARMFLTQAGCLVILAADGIQALEMLRDRRPDLIFMDVHMPRMGGFDACSTIKKDMGLQDVPIIILSACDSGADRMHGKAAGADGYLTKPFSRSGLLDAVATHAVRVPQTIEPAGIRCGPDPNFESGALSGLSVAA